MPGSHWRLDLDYLSSRGPAIGTDYRAVGGTPTSLIGDLVPPEKRSRALAVFMLGLPLGLGLSYAVSGWVAQGWGWRAAFFVAGPPGLLCAALALALREPARRARSDSGHGAPLASPYRRLLSIPTLWWIIASGAVHNFNMYALGTFLSPYLVRVHGLDVRQAGLVSMLAYGLSGIPGLLLGGVTTMVLPEGVVTLTVTGLVVMLTVAKVFLIDMAGLTGVWRAFSFIGLGLVLVGIGYLYQRLLFRKPLVAAATT